MAAPKVAPVFPTKQDVEQNLKPEAINSVESVGNIRHPESGLFRLIFPFIYLGLLTEIVTALIAYYFVLQSLILIAVGLCILALICTFYASRSVYTSRHRHATWILISSLFLTIAYTYWLLGTAINFCLSFIALIALASIFMLFWEIMVVAAVSTFFCASIYVAQHLLQTYTPPLTFSVEVETIFNLLNLIAIVSSTLSFVIIPAYTQARTLAAQNSRLESLLQENSLGRSILQETEQRFEATFEQTAVGIAHFGLDGQWRLVNQRHCEILGYDEAELFQHSLFELTYPDDREMLVNLFQQLGRGEIDKFSMEKRSIKKDGSLVWVSLNAALIRDNKSEPKYVVSILQDIDIRKRAEEALADETERLAVTLRSIGDGVITTNTEGRIVLINSVAEKLTGWMQEEATGRLLPEVFHLVDGKTNQLAPNPVEKVLHTGEILGLAGRTALVARDGTQRFISNSAAPIDRNGQIIGVVLVFRDVSERQKMEEELQKKQKLESLGIMAGGIAHDFNNILTALVGNLYLAKMETRPGEEVYELLAEAETATFRAKDLTQQLLTFSRGGAPIKKTASLKDLLIESVSFALRGSKVRSKIFIPDDLWPVEIDAGQINQVINNLVINADQAMSNGGELIIKAENSLPDFYDRALQLKEGDYVRVTIQDEGVGIPPQNLSKIFDPYFTTKPEGSGLGLTTCFSIIARHEGYIGVISEVNRGTTFIIYLPASPHKKIVTEKLYEGPAHGKGRVLLMDDDKMIRDMGARALRQLGYEVEVAPDGDEAVKLYQEAMAKQERYDIVIMDLTIPGGMGGKEAIAQLLKIDPKVRAIVSSGYSNDPVMANYQSYHFQGVLSKPFLIDELSLKIKELLNGG